MKIKDQKIKDFLDELSCKSPTPGGGAVAALVGAMAAGLVEMVCALTKGGGVQEIADRAKEIRGQLLELSDEDCAAFNAVIKTRTKKALMEAIRVPKETRRLALEVEKLAKLAAKVGNKNAFSDAKSAQYLAEAAAKAAQENIGINEKALAAGL